MLKTKQLCFVIIGIMFSSVSKKTEIKNLFLSIKFEHLEVKLDRNYAAQLKLEANFEGVNNATRI